MSKHSQSVTAIETISEQIQSTMDENKVDVVVCTQSQKTQFLNKFVLLFFDNLSNIIKEYKLAGNDIRVLIEIMKTMQVGNHLNISFAYIAKQLDMAKPNIYKIKKKLYDSKIIIEVDGCTYVNPHIIAKGKFLDTRSSNDKVNLLNKAYEEIENTNLTPSIATKEIKEREKTKKKAKKIPKDVEKLTAEKPPLTLHEDGTVNSMIVEDDEYAEV